MLGVTDAPGSAALMVRLRGVLKRSARSREALVGLGCAVEQRLGVVVFARSVGVEACLGVSGGVVEVAKSEFLCNPRGVFEVIRLRFGLPGGVVLGGVE